MMNKQYLRELQIHAGHVLRRRREIFWQLVDARAPKSFKDRQWRMVIQQEKVWDELNKEILATETPPETA